ncbi:helix-turn-helix domain-containing protein [Streptomyces xiamenensis]
MSVEAPDCLTVPDVMSRLQVGRSTVYYLIRSRRLPSVRIGRARRIPAEGFRDYCRALATEESF